MLKRRKKLFIVSGSTSSGNHLTTRILTYMGCYGTYKNPKHGQFSEQIELDNVVYHGKEPPNEDLCVLMRTIPYNGVYVDLTKIRSKFEEYGYEVKTIIVTRNWPERMDSMKFRHDIVTFDGAFDKLYKEVEYLYLFADRMRPFHVFNISMLFKYPDRTIERLEKFTGLKFPKEKFIDIYNADDKWQYEPGEWLLRTANTEYYNFSKIYSNIHWHISCGSRACGAMLPTLLSAIHAKTVIDIGIAHTFTTQLLSRGLSATAGKEGLLISCDINENSCQLAFAYSKPLPIRHKIIHSDSTKVDWKEAVEGREVDLAFVDGDHSYEIEKQDVINCLPLIRNNGYLVIHDYAPGLPEVVNAVKDALITSNDLWSEIIVPEHAETKNYQAIILQKRKQIWN